MIVIAVKACSINLTFSGTSPNVRFFLHEALHQSGCVFCNGNFEFTHYYITLYPFCRELFFMQNRST